MKTRDLSLSGAFRGLIDMAAVENDEAPAVHFVARRVASFWKVSTWTPQLPHHFLQLPCRLGGSLTPNQAFCLKRQVFVGFIAGAFLSFRFIFSPLKTRDLRLSGAFRRLIDMAAVENDEAPAVHFLARWVASFLLHPGVGILACLIACGFAFALFSWS